MWIIQWCDEGSNTLSTVAIWDYDEIIAIWTTKYYYRVVSGVYHINMVITWPNGNVLKYIVIYHRNSYESKLNKIKLDYTRLISGNGPYPQWHQNIKMVAMVWGLLYIKLLNGTNPLSLRWRNWYTYLVKYIKY